MKEWVGKKSTEIIFGILLAMIGYIAACSWDTLASLPLNYVQKSELHRLEQKMDSLHDKFDTKFDILVKECLQ